MKMFMMKNMVKLTDSPHVPIMAAKLGHRSTAALFLKTLLSSFFFCLLALCRPQIFLCTPLASRGNLESGCLCLQSEQKTRVVRLTGRVLVVVSVITAVRQKIKGLLVLKGNKVRLKRKSREKKVGGRKKNASRKALPVYFSPSHVTPGFLRLIHLPVHSI